jgi:5-methylcytosine-specific restriction endonuclease McrA
MSAIKGKPLSEEHKRNISIAKIGKPCSPEVKRKSSETQKGRPRPESRGSNSPHWNPNLTDKDRLDKRTFPIHLRWRRAVKKRDNYTCQKCDRHTLDNNKLHAHHIEDYKGNIDKRTVLDNGITLCISCHDDFHHQYGYGNNTKTQLEEFLNE